VCWEGMEGTLSGPVEANRESGPASMQQGRRWSAWDDRQTHDWSIIVRWLVVYVQHFR